MRKKTRENQSKVGKTAKERVQENALLIWNLPNGLRNRFKSVCAARGETMKNTIINLLQEFCKNA